MLASLLIASPAGADGVEAALDAVTTELDQAREIQREVVRLTGRIDAGAGFVDPAQARRIAMLERALDELAERRTALASDIANRERIGAGLLPLLEQMTTTLERFVEIDLPFLQRERRARLEELRAALGSADLTLSDRYARVVRAYQQEIAAGYRLEVARDSVRVAGEPRVVDLLRLGRIGLYFVNLDQSQCGAWRPPDAQWVALPEGYCPLLAAAATGEVDASTLALVLPLQVQQ